jgi:hypothetical protein
MHIVDVSNGNGEFVESLIKSGVSMMAGLFGLFVA